jgi:transposase-like protein
MTKQLPGGMVEALTPTKHTREEPMVHKHPSTPLERAQLSAEMLAHPNEHGLITRLSREHNLSRPTLYAWRERARQALLAAFCPAAPSPALTGSLEPHVLTVLLDAHASQRGIQSCLRALTQQGISLQTINSIVQEAGDRALHWMQSDLPVSTRALALDEIYANDRRGAILNVVDVHSGAVWASQGPLPVDTESWILLLWELKEHGLHWDRLVCDGGAAVQAACQTVSPELPLQADQWHVLHSCCKILSRLRKQFHKLKAQTVVVERQVARIAAGKRPLGRCPKTDLIGHTQEVMATEQVLGCLSYLMRELKRLLEVVVLSKDGLLSAEAREQELGCWQSLLSELVSSAPTASQGLLSRLQEVVSDNLAAMLTFVGQVSALQEGLQAVLSGEQQRLLGWAWLHREELGWSSEQVIEALPEAWRSAARMLWQGWEQAVRVSSAVERYHSIVRPHLAVHRSLSNGLLALLAVWHNHRVFTRGKNKGKSPLHLSGMLDAPSDWLVALGYRPEQEVSEVEPSPNLLALAA